MRFITLEERKEKNKKKRGRERAVVDRWYTARHGWDLHVTTKGQTSVTVRTKPNG